MSPSGFVNGVGLLANYTVGNASAPVGGPATSGRAPAGIKAVAVASYADFAAAVADPTVAAVSLLAHIAFPPSQPPLALLGRAISITGNVTACAATPLPPAFAARPPFAPAAAFRFCLLSAAGSQLFRLADGARLDLSRVAVAGCAATQGGCAAAVNGSAISATDSLFADARSLGDGAVFLALARSSVALLRTSFLNCKALAGSGGAVAALANSSISAEASSFDSCTAQWGACTPGEEGRRDVAGSVSESIAWLRAPTIPLVPFPRTFLSQAGRSPH
jgi:hypothetical protein